MPHEIDDLDPDHILSLIDHFEQEDAAMQDASRRGGRSRRRKRSSEPPDEAITLPPDHPLYRPPKPRSAKEQAAYDKATTPTEADLELVRSGQPIRTTDVRHAIRMLKAKQMVAAERGEATGDG